MRLITFEKNAFEEYQEWIEIDRKLAIRIGQIIKDILRDPFKGIGKPKALKSKLQSFDVVYQNKIVQF